MLAEFVAEHHQEIVRRCRVKVQVRSIRVALPPDRNVGVPRFLDQLVDVLRHIDTPGAGIAASASDHGRELHVQGFTLSQVVRDYGDVCQSVTELALELAAPIGVDEFRIMNRCLDDAIASAVTEFGRVEQTVAAAESTREVERLGFLAHELRNLIGTATMAFEVLKTGTVGVGGSTGGVLGRSLAALRDLINRSVDDVRLTQRVRARSHFALSEFIAELAPAAHLEAGARGLTFRVEGGEAEARLYADRTVLDAVLANLLQNGFKFTRPGSVVTLRGRVTADRVLLSVEDECDGLPDGTIDELFRPFVQRSSDRSGLGLGLAMCRWGAEINGGHISARNRAGHGCVFTVDLPRA